MGSVTIIFLIPIMFLVMLFGSVSGRIKGDDVTKVELPYDPAKGVVWEYDGVDDPLFDLIETEVKGDKQIFTFKGRGLFEGVEDVFDKEKGEEDVEPVDVYMVMDVVFTDKNGNELLYYARVNNDYLAFNYKIDFWSPDEYIIFEYTPVEETTVENGEWVGWSRSGDAKEYGEEDGTFSFLVLPDKETGSACELKFIYWVPINNPANPYIEHEKTEMIIQAETGKCEIISEERFYIDPETGLWTNIKPEIPEKQK